MSKDDSGTVVSSGPVACAIIDDFFSQSVWDAQATTHYAAFSRAIIRYVFMLNPQVIGEIDRIVWNIDNDVDLCGFAHGRMARIYTTREGKKFFFYVFASSLPFPPKKWKIMAQTVLMSGAPRKPEESEMLWLE